MSAHLEDRDVVVLCHQEDSALPVLVYNINGSPPLEESAEGISLSISSSRKERSVGVIVQSINTCPPVQRWGRRKVGKEGKREGEGEEREGKEKEEKRGGGREREGWREGGREGGGREKEERKREESSRWITAGSDERLSFVPMQGTH